MYQKVYSGEAASNKVLEGAKTLYTAVKSTMGPGGHCVVIDNGAGAPNITKDGVSVAKAISLRDRLESVGAELLKEVASKTAETAGDGTSSSVVLAYHLLKEGYKEIASGRSSVQLRKGIDDACSQVTKRLLQNVRQVRDGEDIISVGTISANGDRQIGELLERAIAAVGPEGIITLEPAKSVHTTLEVVEGLQLDSGYSSPFFVTNQEKQVAELTPTSGKDCLVLITNRKLSGIEELTPILEQVVEAECPLLIIADDIDGTALNTLIINKVRGNLQVAAIKAPSYGDNRMDILYDIAAVTGGVVFDTSNERKISQAKLEDLGRAAKVTVARGNTTIIGNGGESKQSVVDRVAALRAVVAGGTLDQLRLNNAKKRLAKLAGGIAIIRVGGSTETEVFERKDRVEDALNATQAAVQEGILPGGGISLHNAAANLSLGDNEDFNAGVRILQKACEAPFRVICENLGEIPEVVLAKISKLQEQSCAEIGYNAATGEYGDLLAMGIIDPLRVEKSALNYAVSVIGLLLTSDSIVVNEEDEVKKNG
jgi:chaperonin GroEL